MARARATSAVALLVAGGAAGHGARPPLRRSTTHRPQSPRHRGVRLLETRTGHRRITCRQSDKVNKINT